MTSVCVTARYLFVLQFWAVTGLLLVEGPLGYVANDLQQERVCVKEWRGWRGWRGGWGVRDGLEGEWVGVREG